MGHPSSPSSRAFTLIEMLIVLAIIAVAGGIATLSIQQAKQRQSIQYEVRILKTAIERTRTLATLAGGRIGQPQVGAVRWTLNPPCPQVPGYLMMEVNAGAQSFTYPTGFTITSQGPPLAISVTCETVQLGQGRGFNQVDYQGVLTHSGANDPEQFGFTPSGRTLDAAILPISLGIMIQDSQLAHVSYGIRVLRSGVICQASDMNNETCDAD